MSEAKALRIFLFWSIGDNWLSRLIKRVSCPTHAGIAWQLADGRMEYADALFSAGFRAGKPIAKLYAWEHEKPERKVIIYPTNILNEDAEKIRQKALKLDGKASYFQWQLVQMWAFKRLGLPVRHSPKKVVCSEIQARLVYPHFDFRTPDRPTFDHLSPQDTYEQFMKWRNQ